MTENAVVVTDLVKEYPRVTAVAGISFNIAHGEIFGLLGPNGAGKSTTIRMLLTIAKPTSGSINILGIDALKAPEKVRAMAGYVPQDVSIDTELTGYENILMYAKLYSVPSKERDGRIKEMLNLLGMLDRAKDNAGTYSGGMMRRLELAESLVNRPKILFLDEPSIGLDPSARRTIWDLIKKLRTEYGTTILITTHDMGEADVLCDRVGIINHGKLSTIGTPTELKNTLGGDVVTVTSQTPGYVDKLREAGYSLIGNPQNGTADLLVNNGEKLIPHLVETMRDSGVELDTVSLKKPTLDDVFLKYTGERIEEGDTGREARRQRRTMRRLTK